MEPIKSKRSFLNLPRNVKFLGLVSFLNDISSDMVFPLVPVFLTSVLGASNTFVGVIEGIADFTASVLKIGSGWFSDKLKKRKPFAVLGYSISAVAKPILAFAMAPWHVLVVRFLDRVGKGTRDAPRDALISFSVEKKDLGRAFGFHRGADTAGAAIGPLLAMAFLYFYPGRYRMVFLLSFVMSFLAVLVLQLFVREVKNHHDDLPKPKFEFKFLGLPFAVFLIASVIFSLGKASEAFLILRAQSAGIAIVLIPAIYFLYNITYALFSTPAGILSDKIGHRNTFMLGMLIFSGTYFLFSVVTSVLAVWFLFAVYGFYSAFTEGVGRAIVADLVGPEFRATAYGMYNAFTGLALLPASIIFGYLADKFGFSYAFSYGGVLGIAAFVVFLFLRVANHKGKI